MRPVKSASTWTSGKPLQITADPAARRQHAVLVPTGQPERPRGSPASLLGQPLRCLRAARDAGGTLQHFAADLREVQRPGGALQQAHAQFYLRVRSTRLT